MTHRPVQEAAADGAVREAPAGEACPAPVEPAPHDAAYDWWLTEDLDAFLDRAGAFLHGAPALHTLLLTVTDALRTRGAHAFGAGTPHFGAWVAGAGRVAGAFVRTPPLDLLLSPLPTGSAGDGAANGSGGDAAGARDRERAVTVLADRLAARVPDLAGVSSDRATAAAFAAAWERRTGATHAPRENLRLHRLGTLTPPVPPPPGRARIATRSDRELLVRWAAEFQRDIGGAPLHDPGGWVDSRISYGGVTLWETPDGLPVSMAGATPPVVGQVRVAPVYTPPERRGRGYAGAATAAVSRRLRDAGVTEVLLFTDLANPTSNALYQRIGYRPVTDFDKHAFTPPPGVTTAATASTTP
ncbi:GNAT family N-acetyltransferase [Streptomyces odontomachi]|uniref:GNAT family N-acetyltransferase n=1 Tax=Streptomyces odontomachi TaxID=2944940 RepID=UPI002108711B|nr:GNAT family N-acetyltransferase [Streptomyces sp. ODS25]